MKHINIVNESDCCGCNACVQACSLGCIRMKSDNKGFWYPSIDTERCIDCGKCVSVCQMFDEAYNNTAKLENIKVYAIKHKDDAVRKKSSSGGMFTALSDYIIAHGGIVYGAAYDENFNVIQASAASSNERNKMRGSKYVQSYVGNSYRETEHFLKQGKLVLYTGTPCQIAGLYKYLGSQYDNLFTCDLVCHGAPSPEVLKKYIEYVQIRANDKIKNINFRHKMRGWNDLILMIDFDNGSYSNLLSCDPYGKIFLDNIDLRPVCYQCKYATVSRPADITLGDYWGINRSMPDFNDNKGVSLVFINTKKGELLFENIRQYLNVRHSRLEDCVPYNNTLYSPSRKPDLDGFWNDYINGEDFSYVLSKHAVMDIINNRYLLEKAIYHYVISYCCKNNADENSDSIINRLSAWKEWCNRTFIKIPEKYDKEMPEYKKCQEEAYSFGAFLVTAYYANKRNT